MKSLVVWFFRDANDPFVADLSGRSYRIVQFLRATGYAPHPRWPKTRVQP